jgi:hypothetical protein
MSGLLFFFCGPLGQLRFGGYLNGEQLFANYRNFPAIIKDQMPEFTGGKI